MGLFQYFRQVFLWLRYRRAAFVGSLAELEAALRDAPPRIVVDGDEALRAYAATLLEPNAEKFAQLQAAAPAPAPGEPPVYMLVPKVGRIRDGYRTVRKPPAQAKRLRLKRGVDSIVIAAIGIVAALLMEWLIFPDQSPRMVRGPHRAGLASLITGTPASTPPAPRSFDFAHLAVEIAIPVLGAVALGAAGWLAWQAMELGRPVRVEWRLEKRVPGRLIMGRVRKRG